MSLSFSAFVAFRFLSATAYGHWVANVPSQLMDWQTDQISRVVAEGNGQLSGLDGKKCLEGSSFLFDVDDRYAFDIDETVQVEVEFYRHAKAAAVEVSYEKNGEAEAKIKDQIPAYKDGKRTYKATFPLERARFAGRGLFRTDFSIRLGADDAGEQGITICSISLRRSYATVVPKAFGNIALEVADETGHPVPARVGIYDKTGRLPLPSEDAFAVKRLDEMVRVVSISPGLESIPWPARNRSGFYINGFYRAKLPVGRYDLVVAKGPEYRFIRRSFTVEGVQTQALKVNLQRWDNWPAKGWYSGDNHIHYIRHDANDDPNLLLFTQAEDVHVASILQMGDIATVAWPQYGWRPYTTTNESYSFVPGQEDPRTPRHGHTISLHLKEPVRDPQSYLLYHEVFEKARAQGGVTGYAHVVGRGAFNARGGLALDIPFGLVDFVEVMQFGYGGSSVWFDFLNLGYKLAPSAGTDYMTDCGVIGTLPGAERSYVYVPNPFSLQGWFDALKRGETFVTNGPMLEFTVNGKGMGSELRLKSGDKLIINAVASINPDIDSLESLELIEQGEVVKKVSARKAGDAKLQLHHEMTAKSGTWFVVRARGRLPHGPRALVPQWEANQLSAKIAFSGAVYIYVDGQSFWKPSAVPAIVQGLKHSLEKLMAPATGEEEPEGAFGDTGVLLWDSQKALLKQRVDQVIPIYDRLVTQARAAVECQSNRFFTHKGLHVRPERVEVLGIADRQHGCAGAADLLDQHRAGRG